jgi:hypothetical protein
MGDPVARKRLKKRMLDRWENEGGKIATDTTSSAPTTPTTEGQRHLKKLSSPCDNSTAAPPASPRKGRQGTRK